MTVVFRRLRRHLMLEDELRIHEDPNESILKPLQGLRRPPRPPKAFTINLG
jgi:hypothetical protein